MGGLDVKMQAETAAGATAHPAAELALCSQTAGISWLQGARVLQLDGRPTALTGALRRLGQGHVPHSRPKAFRHGWLYRIASDQALILLDVNASEEEAVRSLVRAFADIALTDASARYETIAVVGPASGGVVKAASVMRGVVAIRAADIDYLIVAESDVAADVWTRLLDAGRASRAAAVSARTVALIAIARRVANCQRLERSRGDVR